MPKCKGCIIDDKPFQEWIDEFLSSYTKEYIELDSQCEECGSPAHQVLEQWNVQDIRFECFECGDVHHPCEREEHDFRLDVKVCPECRGKRSRIIHDLDGPVPV